MFNIRIKLLSIVVVTILLLFQGACYMPKNNANEDELYTAIINKDSKQLSTLIQSQLVKNDTVDVITEIIQVTSVLSLDTTIYEVMMPFLDQNLIDVRQTSLFINAFWALSVKYDLFPSADGKISQDYKDAIKYLVKNGISPNLVGEFGAEIIIRELSDYELVKTLFESGFSAETILKNDSTILDFAVYNLFTLQSVKFDNYQVPIFKDTELEIFQELDIIDYIFKKSEESGQFETIEMFLLNIPAVRQDEVLLEHLLKWREKT